MCYARKSIIHALFRRKWKFPSLGITVLAGTRQSLVPRQTQLSIATEISIPPPPQPHE